MFWKLFFSFFFPSLSKATSRTAELPSLCNVFSSTFCSLFRHDRIYLNYCINKHRDKSFEFSSILSTVDQSKHLITAWIIRKFIQLVNLWLSESFFFLFRQSSMVKPKCAGTFGKWAIFLKETSIITGTFYLLKRSYENLVNVEYWQQKFKTLGELLYAKVDKMLVLTTKHYHFSCQSTVYGVLERIIIKRNTFI